MTSKHKYRTSIYLGKENYEIVEKLSKEMMLPISSLVKIIFCTGLEMTKQIEKRDSNGK